MRNNDIKAGSSNSANMINAAANYANIGASVADGIKSSFSAFAEYQLKQQQIKQNEKEFALREKGLEFENEKLGFAKDEFALKKKIAQNDLKYYDAKHKSALDYQASLAAQARAQAGHLNELSKDKAEERLRKNEALELLKNTPIQQVKNQPETNAEFDAIIEEAKNKNQGFSARY